MRETKRILVAAVWADPNDPRQFHNEAQDRARGENMLAIGQQVPILAYQDGERTIVIDGHGRVRSAKMVGIKELDAIIWPGKPTPNEILLAQLGIDFHRSNFSAMDRSDSIHRAKKILDCSVNDLAAKLNIGQPLCSKYLALQRLCPEARTALHEKALDIERAHIISQAPDHAKQLELLNAATTCSREQLRRRAAHGVASPEPKASAAKFSLPGGYTISISGAEFDLSTCVEVLTETVRMLKKGLSQRLSLESQMRVMRDTAKAGG